MTAFVFICFSLCLVQSDTRQMLAIIFDAVHVWGVVVSLKHNPDAPIIYLVRKTSPFIIVIQPEEWIQRKSSLVIQVFYTVKRPDKVSHILQSAPQTRFLRKEDWFLIFSIFAPKASRPSWILATLRDVCRIGTFISKFSGHKCVQSDTQTPLFDSVSNIYLYDFAHGVNHHPSKPFLRWRTIVLQAY